MAAFCCIYGLNDGEEAIGSERVVGERKLAPREPYGARRTRLREYPVPLGSPLKKSAIEALILCVMRSGVIIASQIDLSEAMITQQVTDAQLLSVLLKHAKLLS